MQVLVYTWGSGERVSTLFTDQHQVFAFLSEHALIFKDLQWICKIKREGFTKLSKQNTTDVINIASKIGRAILNNSLYIFFIPTVTFTCTILFSWELYLYFNVCLYPK